MLTKENRRQIATFIKIKRVERDINQTTLAKMANIAVKSLSSIENCEVVRDKTIKKVLNTLGYELDVVQQINILPLNQSSTPIFS